MATRAERFKLQTQRAAQAKKPKRKPKSRPPREARPGLRARDALVARHDRSGTSTPHNVAPRATKNSTYSIESAGEGRASRKSTRKGATRVKPDSSLRMRATSRATSPRSRASR